MNEQQGCTLLARVFSEHGYNLQLNVSFDEDGVSFNIDGWDPVARVGFEYMTREIHANTGISDFADLDDKERDLLENKIREGSLFIFVIDEKYLDTEEELQWAATQFLERVAAIRAERDTGRA